MALNIHYIRILLGLLTLVNCTEVVQCVNVAAQLHGWLAGCLNTYRQMTIAMHYQKHRQSTLCSFLD